MLKGGYQIINFEGINFTRGETKKIDGIYEKIEGTTKALLISGLSLDGVNIRDFFTIPTVKNGKYHITYGDKTIVIDDNDNVVFSHPKAKTYIIDVGSINEWVASVNISNPITEAFVDKFRGEDVNIIIIGRSCDNPDGDPPFAEFSVEVTRVFGDPTETLHADFEPNSYAFTDIYVEMSVYSGEDYDTLNIQ